MKTIIAFFLCWQACCAFGQNIILNENQQKEIKRNFHFFQDTSKNLNVAAASYACDSKGLPGTVAEKVAKGHFVYWICFAIQNNTGSDGEFILDFQNWSFVNAYTKNENNYELQKTGHLLPFAKRDYPEANKAYILIHLKQKEIRDFIVRLESTENNDLVPEELGFKISPRSFIDSENRKNSIIIFSFLAVLFIMFFYNLFIYISTRLESYIFYLVVIIFTFYHTSYNSGYLFELFSFFNSLPVLLFHFEKISSILYGISIILFASKFLAIKYRYPAWNKIVRVIIYAFLVSGLIIFIHEETGKLISVLIALATIISILVLAIKSTKDKYPAAKYFLIGYSLFLLSSIVLILALMHVIERNDWTVTYSLPLGSTLEIVFFSFALANLINELRRKNNENEQRQREYIIEKENRESRFQHELLKTQLEIQEQTFQNISEEIHDNIGQKLILTKLNVNTINYQNQEEAQRKLQECRNLLSEAIQDLRDLSKTLNTGYINEIGLSEALERQLEMIRKAGAFHMEVSIQGDKYKLNAQHELVVFRTVQELLNNVIKHAHASTIKFTAEYLPDKLLVMLQDNGVGFEHALKRKDPGGLGLRNIEHRIRLIRGTIRFESQDEKGTTVKIEIPRE